MKKQVCDLFGFQIDPSFQLPDMISSNVVILINEIDADDSIMKLEMKDFMHIQRPCPHTISSPQ